MRGILFGLSFVAALIAMFSSIDTVGAMDGIHVGVSWIWWAIALVFLQLAPSKSIQRDLEGEFMAAAAGWSDPEWPIYVAPVQADFFDGPDYIIGWGDDIAAEVAFDGIEVEHFRFPTLPTITPTLLANSARIRALRAGLNQAATYYDVFAIRRELRAALRA